MRRAIFTFLLFFFFQVSAWAWSVIAVDKKSGQIVISAATCVAQATSPTRSPAAPRDLMDIEAVIVPGVGIAACDASADNTHKDQMFIFNELKKGTDPALIIAMLQADPNIDYRQFGILDMQGRAAGFDGTGINGVAIFQSGQTGDFYFQVQGNFLRSAEAVFGAARAFNQATGTLADHVMAAMETVDANGGDKRCSCNTEPKSKAKCKTKTAQVAYMLIVNKTDVTERSHNQGKYYTYLRVTDLDVQPNEDANPVKTLRMRYDAWKEGGSKPFSSVPTIRPLP